MHMPEQSKSQLTSPRHCCRVMALSAVNSQYDNGINWTLIWDFPQTTKHKNKRTNKKSASLANWSQKWEFKLKPFHFTYFPKHLHDQTLNKGSVMSIQAFSFSAKTCSRALCRGHTGTGRCTQKYVEMLVFFVFFLAEDRKPNLSIGKQHFFAFPQQKEIRWRRWNSFLHNEAQRRNSSLLPEWFILTKHPFPVITWQQGCHLFRCCRNIDCKDIAVPIWKCVCESSTD